MAPEWYKDSKIDITSRDGTYEKTLHLINKYESEHRRKPTLIIMDAFSYIEIVKQIDSPCISWRSDKIEGIQIQLIECLVEFIQLQSQSIDDVISDSKSLASKERERFDMMLRMEYPHKPEEVKE